MSDHLTEALGGAWAAPEMEPAGAAPKRSGSLGTQPHRWKSIIVAVGLAVIVVGVLYPLGSWLWQSLEDWMVRLITTHIANLEALLRELTGVRTHYPT
jgi:hypothetical protein